MISLLTKDKSFKLLESIGELRSEEAFHDVNLICQDGNIKTSGLLLASISPLFKLIGSCHHPRLLAGETTVILPDVSVKCLEQFLQSIVSPVPPHDPEQIQVIQDLLQFIGHGAHQNSEQKTAKKKLFKEDKVCPNADNDKNDDLMDESWNGHCDNSSLENEVGNGSVNSKCKVNLKGPKLKSMDVKEINDALDDKVKMAVLMKVCYDKKRSLYVCNICGAERKTTRTLQQHLSWHKTYPNEDFHTSNICKVCGKVCTDHSLLRAHVRLVHSPRSIRCTFEGCNKSFKSKEGLKQHLNVHSGVKNFVCSECGYAVRSKHHLQLHVVKKHTIVKRSIPCEVCGKLFRHMSNLKCHFYTHKAREERQLRCDPCNLTFRKEASLNAHMALHDPTRPFKCSKCPLRYKNKDALVAHESTHENLQFRCDQCDVVYTRKDNLKRHFKDKHPFGSNTNITFSEPTNKMKNLLSHDQSKEVNVIVSNASCPPNIER